MATTNTNVRIEESVMESFKEVIKKEGFRLQKGLENALKEYTAKRVKKQKGD